MEQPISRRGSTVRAWPLAALMIVVSSSYAGAQITERVSTSSTGSEGNSYSFWGVPSADGRYVAFQSFASKLVRGDANYFVPDIFVKDRVTGATTLVSVDSAGVQGNSPSAAPSISGDGMRVAFESDATNLVASDTNGVRDVFVHDRGTGVTTLVSTSYGGLAADAPSFAAVISADGRFVAFESDASNIVRGDKNYRRDVFVQDLGTGMTWRANTDALGMEAEGISSKPSISADGRFVAFVSNAPNLVEDDSNAVYDVFVKDLLSGAILRASVTSTGGQTHEASSFPTISGDGRWVAFASDCSALVPGDRNLCGDVYLHDTWTSETTRVSVDSGGAEADGQSMLNGSCLVSYDGRFVAFDSLATNIVAGDTNGVADCFVHDHFTGVTTRVDVSSAGEQSSSRARASAISADGRCVLFESAAPKLVRGDNNYYWDVFLHDRGELDVVSFCFGAGAGAACPCGNFGAAGNGCASSVNTQGANLSWNGEPSLAADTFILRGSGLAGNVALYFQGTKHVNVTFGDGRLCTGGDVIRLAVKPSASGQSQFPDARDPSIFERGACRVGAQRLYQVWYRNADPKFCTPSTFNLTNALAVVWNP